MEIIRKEERLVITINVIERHRNNKTKVITETTKIYLFKSTDKARKFLYPIVSEMKSAKQMKREPLTYINGVSFDTRSERALLLEMGAIELQDQDYD